MQQTNTGQATADAPDPPDQERPGNIPQAPQPPHLETRQQNGERQAVVPPGRAEQRRTSETSINGSCRNNRRKATSAEPKRNFCRLWLRLFAHGGFCVFRGSRGTVETQGTRERTISHRKAQEARSTLNTSRQHLKLNKSCAFALNTPAVLRKILRVKICFFLSFLVFLADASLLRVYGCTSAQNSELVATESGSITFWLEERNPVVHRTPCKAWGKRYSIQFLLEVRQTNPSVHERNAGHEPLGQPQEMER